MMRQPLYFIIVLILSGFTQKVLQDENKLILQKLKEVNSYHLSNPNYKVQVNHILYSSPTNSEVKDLYSGFYLTSNGMEHSFLLGIETIQNEEIRVSIDSSAKIINITNPRKTAVFSHLVIEESLKQSKNKKFVEVSGKSIITLEFDSRKSPVSKLKVEISKNRISSLDMWHTEQVNIDENKTIFPHTRIEFNDYDENIKFRKKDFDISHVLIKSKNIYTLTPKYKGYKLIDLRNPS
jgi:hypothetical protein